MRTLRPEKHFLWIYYGVRVLSPTSCGGGHLVVNAVFCRGHMQEQGRLTSVTHAVLTNWEYMDVIRLAADPKCSSNLVDSISMIDSPLKFGLLRDRLKTFLGLSELQSDKDFVSVLELDDIRSVLRDAEQRYADPERRGAYGAPASISLCILNHKAFGTVKNVVALCPQDMDLTVEDYLTTAPPVAIPTIISRLLDIDYEHKIFIQAFPPSEYYKVWDENGLRKGEKEPKKIRQIHSEMVEFVKAWLEDWGRPLL
ncbi:hypothetical protein BGW80DRAFT_1462080 [Lactifluus volemus]|nr:hypothetical protein BGW80DRAFT_1462080 [Lactifluus volemus]